MIGFEAAISRPERFEKAFQKDVKKGIYFYFQLE